MYFKKCKNLLWLSWRFCPNCFYKGHVFLLFCLVIHIYIHCCTVFSFQKLTYTWNNMFDHKLVSFDVKSLFTSIPLQLALECTENAIKNSTVELPLPTDDIMDLLNLCLTLTYFQYNGKHYKQLHGTAMGSPVSVVVAEIVMQNIEEQVLATYTRTVPLWLRSVDDTFTAVHKEGIDDFHEPP